MTIYTDGSALGNPGPGGWAALICDGKRERVLQGGEDHSTNNRMEMTAVLCALQWLGEQKTIPDSIVMYSDSRLLIQTITEGWKRKKNQDLWLQIDQAFERIAARVGKNTEEIIEWNWVKGHHEDPFNIRVDQLAQQQARMRRVPQSGAATQETKEGTPTKPQAQSSSQESLF